MADYADDPKKMPDRIFAFPFSRGYRGGYYRTDNRHPIDDKERECSAEYVRADLLKN